MASSSSNIVLRLQKASRQRVKDGAWEGSAHDDKRENGLKRDGREKDFVTGRQERQRRDRKRGKRRRPSIRAPSPSWIETF